MQVYRHMDIGSAKIRPEEMEGIPHYLVDILEPTQDFNVVLFQKYAKDLNISTPKIQMVVLTHCGWSTTAGARNKPNQQTEVYVKKIYDILNRNRTLLTTGDPTNHLFLLDDFLGSGRISSALSKPLELLRPGESKAIDRVKVSVNDSVKKCKNQLKFINSVIW